eukprot:4436545-Prorocentrum_lima.AAC.1
MCIRDSGSPSVKQSLTEVLVSNESGLRNIRMDGMGPANIGTVLSAPGRSTDAIPAQMSMSSHAVIPS